MNQCPLHNASLKFGGTADHAVTADDLPVDLDAGDEAVALEREGDGAEEIQDIEVERKHVKALLDFHSHLTYHIIQRQGRPLATGLDFWRNGIKGFYDKHLPEFC